MSVIFGFPVPEPLSSSAVAPKLLVTTKNISKVNKISMKGYAISDFHHGPIAQVKPGDPVFVIVPSGKTVEDSYAIIEKLRGVSADIIVVTDDMSLVPADCEKIVTVPSGSELISPFLTVAVFKAIFVFL